MEQTPLMSKLKEGEELTVYLGVSQYTINATLVQKENRVQYLVYYVSHNCWMRKSDIPL